MSTQPTPSSSSDDDVAYMPLGQVLAGFRTGALSPVAYLGLLIARTQRIGPILNPYTRTYFDAAMVAAEQAEQRYRRGGRVRALEGVPVVVKDLHRVAGQPVTYGCHLLAGNMASDTAPAVERLLKAGAILLARSTVPEFGLSFACNTRAYGVTRNPWNLAMSPGGSTSGGAAALAAGLTPLADASDYGGSIRIPAAFCGLFGFKPPYGRVPSHPQETFDQLGAYGALTRTVDDAVLVYRLLYGSDARDIGSLAGTYRLAADARAMRGRRIAYCFDFAAIEVEDEVRRHVGAGLQALRDLGCSVEEVHIGWDRSTLLAFELHAAAAFAATWADRLGAQSEELGPLARRRLDLASKLSGPQLYATLSVRARMYEELTRIFASHELLVCPTTAVTGIAAEQSPMDGRAVDVDGWTVSAEQQLSLTYPFNLLAQLPVASLPCGLARNGLPVGVQLCGRPYRDNDVLKTAAILERTLAFDHRPTFAHRCSIDRSGLNEPSRSV